MKYPAFMRRINGALAYIAGVMLVIISVFAVFEAISRSVFSSPTSWSMDLSCYLLLWAIFLGTAYAYQEKGHVAVDLLLDVIQRRFGKAPRRAMSAAGYILVLVTVIALLYGGLSLFEDAIAYGKLTTATFQVPIAYMYAGIVIGSAVTVVTAIFIVLDLISGSDTYL
jgi:TRAP-type C4-dicarboxylate transport system permease small subunit